MTQSSQAQIYRHTRQSIIHSTNIAAHTPHKLRLQVENEDNRAKILIFAT